LASFTGPEVPKKLLSLCSITNSTHVCWRKKGLFRVTRIEIVDKVMVEGCATKGRLTFGLDEIALLNTSLDRLVELAVKGVLRSRSQLIVCQHIFFDRLAAVIEIRS
jgi:hypothetical protein